jgi:hypothetical protein
MRSPKSFQSLRHAASRQTESASRRGQAIQRPPGSTDTPAISSAMRLELQARSVISRRLRPPRTKTMSIRPVAESSR